MNKLIIIVGALVAIAVANDRIVYIDEDWSESSIFKKSEGQLGTKKLNLCRTGVIEPLPIKEKVSLEKEWNNTFTYPLDTKQCNLNYFMIPALVALARNKYKSISKGLNFYIIRNCLYTADACDGGDVFYAMGALTQYGLPLMYNGLAPTYEFNNFIYEPNRFCDKPVKEVKYLPVMGWYKVDLSEDDVIQTLKRELKTNGPVLACTDEKHISKLNGNEIFTNPAEQCDTFVMITGWGSDWWYVTYHTSSWGINGVAKFSFNNNTFFTNEVYALAMPEEDLSKYLIVDTE